MAILMLEAGSYGERRLESHPHRSDSNHAVHTRCSRKGRPGHALEPLFFRAAARRDDRCRCNRRGILFGMPLAPPAHAADASKGKRFCISRRWRRSRM